MADEELAAIRAKRLEELQTQYGVRSYLDYVFPSPWSWHKFLFWEFQGQNSAQMQQQQEAIKRLVCQ